MHLRELKTSGHAPSLFAAFVHFDISFMVWVILGALMPYIANDAGLTGANLRITPTAQVRASGQYTIVIKGPQTVKDNPKLKADQPHTVYNLLVKPGSPAQATRASVLPVEKYVLDNANPATLASLNAHSQLIQVAMDAGAKGNPNENVLALESASGLDKAGKSFQTVANGYPAAVKLALVGLPLLAAGFWRLLLGLLVDRFNSRRVGIASLIVTLLPLVIGWKMGGTYASLLCIGFFLGVAGASFAVSLPLASRWYPPHLQGVAMGLAGMGNSGTVMATICAPMLARTFGWHVVMGLLALPVLLTLAVFTLLAKDPPVAGRGSKLKDYMAVLATPDAWWFCALYFVTFGGFVGLSSFFNTFFVDQYDAPKAAVGLWTWPFILAGSLIRPIGGALADRIGGIRMLTLLYAVVTVCALGVGLFLHNFPVACVLLFVLMACLGMGNGSVFQLVPQRFKKEIGVMTGLVGAAGGVGGYYLNFALGHLHDATGTYASGFYAFAAIALAAFVILRVVSPGWMRSWLGKGGVAHAPETLPYDHAIVALPTPLLEPVG